MPLILKIITVVSGFIFISTIIYLLLKRRLNERHSIYWIAGAAVILAISFFPQILNYLSGIIGISYPPTLLFFSSTMIMVFILLHHSIQVTELQDKVRELAQVLAILRLEVGENNGIKSINAVLTKGEAAVTREEAPPC